MSRIVLPASLVVTAAVLVSCGGGGGGGSPTDQSPPRSPSAPGPEPATWVEIAKVADQFRGNQIAAERAYAGKRVRVRCVVRAIGRGAGGAAEAGGASSIDSLKVDTLFRFAKAREEDVARVQTGQHVVVEGTVSRDRAGYAVALVDCAMRPYRLGEPETPKPSVDEARHFIGGATAEEIRQLIGQPDAQVALTKKSFTADPGKYSCEAYDRLCTNNGADVRVYIVYYKNPSSGRITCSSFSDQDPNVVH